jgi:MoaA/NifB/PqqE/SkfB family radical SAM enzyme
LNPDYENAQFGTILLDRLWQNGVTHLNILGKEPFLYPHINSILRHACNRGFVVDITTNGTAIEYNNISWLVAIGLRSIYFSLDGSCPAVNDVIRGNGTFHKTLTTMQKFLREKEKQESPLQVNVNTVLTKINKPDIYNIINLCSANGVSAFKLSRLEMVGRVIHHLDRLFLKPEEEFNVAEELIKRIPQHPKLALNILSIKPLFLEYLYKKFGAVFPIIPCGCKACREEIYIDPAGHISPCLSTSIAFSTLTKQCDERKKENVLEIGDKPISALSSYREFRSAFKLTERTYKNYIPCNSCPYLATICYPCPLHSSNSVHK